MRRNTDKKARAKMKNLASKVIDIQEQLGEVHTSLEEMSEKPTKSTPTKRK